MPGTPMFTKLSLVNFVMKLTVSKKVNKCKHVRSRTMRVEPMCFRFY